MPTHNDPAAKIAEIPIFFDIFICRRHTHTIGRSKIKKSETTLTAEVTKIGMLILIHDPSTYFSQILCRGVHSKILTNVSAR